MVQKQFVYYILKYVYFTEAVEAVEVPSPPDTTPSASSNECWNVFLCKSRTAGRTRCDCFHTQEVITLDLPQLWLRLINIDKQLMRCRAETRPLHSCLLMTPMERKNDLNRQCHCLSQMAAKVVNYLQSQSKIISSTAGLLARPSQSGHYRSLWRYNSP